MHILVTASRALLAWTVHMPGNAAVEGDEQVEALLLTHLPDDDPRRTHAQRLLDEPSQRDLAGALEAGLPALHRGDVALRDLQLEDLLARDDAFTRRDGCSEAVEQGRLARLRAAGDEDVESARDGRLEERRRLPGHRAQPDQVVEVVGLDDELADVDLPVGPADVGDHDVEPRPVRQRRVDEGAAEVDAPAAALEHALDEVAHLVRRQDRRGQLGDPAPRDEDARGFVDPDLLDGGVVEVLLERAVAGHDREDRVNGESLVAERRQAAVQRALVVVLHGVLHQAAHGLRVARRVQTRAADQLADLTLDMAHRFLSGHASPLTPVSCFARHPARWAAILAR